MKKTFWSLAALMLMAAPMMTSCSNNLDEVAPAEEAKSNVVTITIAPPVAEPESRVAMSGLGITGWALYDEVTLYPTERMEHNMDITGEGVTFKCVNPTNGIFSAVFSGNINSYNLAVFNCTVVKKGEEVIDFIPKTWSSTELKDVVMMAAFKESSSYAMKIINNVVKIENTKSDDVVVGWYGWNSYEDKNTFYNLATQYAFEHDEDSWKWRGKCVDDAICSWGNAHFTLKANAVNYVNFPMVYNDYTSDNLGLYTSDGGTAVLPMQGLGGKANVYGKLYNAPNY